MKNAAPILIEEGMTLHDLHTQAPPGAPSWISWGLVLHTQVVFQPKSETMLSLNDLIEMVLEFGRLADVGIRA